MWATVRTVPVSAVNNGPAWTTESRASMICRASPPSGVARGRLFFERAAGSAQVHSSRSISSPQSPRIFATTGTRQKLKLHDVRRLGWEGAGIEPFPERFDFLHRQHAVTRRPRIISLQTSGGVRFHDVLRQGPPEHGADSLPALLGFPLDPLVSHRVQQSRDVAPETTAGVATQDRSTPPPQTALDFLCRPQAAGNPAPHIQFNQFFDGDPGSRGSSALFFLGDQVAARPCRAGQVV